MDLAEDLLVSVVARVLDKRRQPELKALERDTTKLERVQAPFPRITYDEAVELLQREGPAVRVGRRLRRRRRDGDLASSSTARSGAPLPGRGQGVLHEARSGAARGRALRRRARARGLRRDHRRRPALDDDDLLLAAHRGARAAAGGLRVVSRPAPLRHRCRTPASAWASSACVAWICGLHHVRETIPFPRMLYRDVSRSTVVEAGSSRRSAPGVWSSAMKIGFVSLGCPKNLVDGEVMLGIAQQAGHEITSDAAARRRARREHVRLHRQRQAGVDRRHPRDGAALKASGGQRLVVTGCLAERYRDELRKEIPEIDAVLGTGEVPDIRRRSTLALGARPRLETRGSGPGLGGSGLAPPGPCRRSCVDQPTSSAPNHRSSAERRAPSRRPISTTPTTPRLLTTPKHFAYVKIAEGCDYTCAFCIIPTLRGQYRSRTVDSIVARGARARRPRRQGAAPHLAGHDLLRHRPRRARRAGEAAARAERDRRPEWIRLLYLYPTTITDDVLAAMAECEKVCRYIDLPLQHAVGRRAQADAAARATAQTYDKLLARHPRPRAGRHPADDLHRRLPRRDRGRLRRARRVRRRHGVRPRRRVHLLARGRHPRLRRRGRRAGGDQAEAPQRHDGDSSRHRRDRHRRAGSGRRRGADRRPVARARTGAAGPARRSGAGNRPGRLPDRLRSRGLRFGQIIKARIVGAQGYDLLVTPLA